ncbi:MAG: hypothetical protein K2M64_04055, partial [Clostridia bacterium]|nr:hypothetical protein [Clostridia bacterium]
PTWGTEIVYDFQSDSGSEIFAVRKGNDSFDYWNASSNGNGGYIIDDIEFVHDINYVFSHGNSGKYTLVISTMPYVDQTTGIYYAASSVSYEYVVRRLDLSADADNFANIFGEEPTFNSINYTGDNSWLTAINLQLSIGDVELQQDSDYYLTIEVKNGLGYITIHGTANLDGSYTFSNAVQISSAPNSWGTLPNIRDWAYGDFNIDVNMIHGLPVYPLELAEDNINDITFRIVLVDKYGVEQEITGLDAIHYVIVGVEENGKPRFSLSNEVVALLNGLSVGTYRLHATVAGAANEQYGFYQSIEETAEGIEFVVRQGNNTWGIDTTPTVVSWTAGKFNPETNFIGATDRFGNDAIIVIKNGNGEIVYSNSPEHTNQKYCVYGKNEAEVNKLLKSLKAGYYTMIAEVEGTADYEGITTFVEFTIAPNGLPTWAVVLIVVGALGIVALVFFILHQKGILQMLTGKVILSMRTRANVDATLAAIRAAKVAREAEASIAAAKAREAEEAAKNNKGE